MTLIQRSDAVLASGSQEFSVPKDPQNRYALTRVRIHWEIRDKGAGPVLSMQGDGWAPGDRLSDPNTVGQIQDTIRREVLPRLSGLAQRERLARMLDIWDRWHLNDLRAGCEHQRQDPAFDPARELVVVTYKLTTAAYQKRERAIKQAARWAALMFDPALDPALRVPCPLDAVDRALILLDRWHGPHYTTPAEGSLLAGCFEIEKRETKRAGWVTPKEHPEGILCAPCPVCGYRYGSQWLMEPLPVEVIEEVQSWTA